MTKALADMVTDLQEDVPAVDGVPTDAQYERAIKDAVAEFSRLCGLKKTTTLSIVSGTAVYSLATDFLKMITIDALVGIEGVIVSSKLIPVSKDFEEEYTIVNKTITFYPTPAYTMTRYYSYKAAWVLDESDEYPLTDDEVEIVMLKAKAIAFEKINNASASAGFKYSIGNMSVDKSGVSEGYGNRVKNFEERFEKACRDYNGAYSTC